MADAAVAFDLEFTSWDGAMQGRWLEPGQFREVVQIGAVKLNRHTLTETGSFNMLVRPRINPILSDYLVTLTGITNARIVAEGVDFMDAYQAFTAFCAGGPLCAFGRDDLVLYDNLRLYGLSPEPVFAGYTNIAVWLRVNGIDATGKHACHVGPLCGGAFTGHEHDALDDARSVASGIQALVAKGAPNPFL